MRNIQKDLKTELSFCVVTLSSEPEKRYAVFKLYGKSDEEKYSKIIEKIAANSSGLTSISEDEFKGLEANNKGDFGFWGSDDCSDTLSGIWGVNFNLRR